VFVPHVRTPVPLAGLRDLLDRAHHSLFGSCPGPAALSVFEAHLRLEHGVELRGDEEQLRGVWCFNVGNVDATAEQIASGREQVFRTVPECEGPMCAHRATHTRRAYPDLDSGIVGYIEAMRDRFPNAFYRAVDGPAEFVRGLVDHGYFTANPAVYAGSLARLYIQIERGTNGDH
jgi:hypothetical protein